MYAKCGILEDACTVFDRMSERDVVSWNAMLTSFSHNGQCDKAWNLFDVWGALLNACRMHCNLDLAEHAACCLFELEPENAANYVLLSNIFAAASRWDDVAKVRKSLKHKVLERSPGCSWIEINNRVHAFLVGDQSHPQMEKIYAKLEDLSRDLEEAVYEWDPKLIAHDVEGE